MASTEVPNDLAPYFQKGVQAYTQGSYEYSIDLLTFVIKQAPDATEARRYLRLAIQKNFSKNPPSPIVLFGLGILTLPVRAIAIIAQEAGQTEQATQLFEWLLNINPGSTALLLRLATTLSKRGLDDAAIQTYEELLAVDSNHLPGLRKLARLAMKRSDDTQSRDCFERILKLKPTDVEAQQSIRNLDALGTLKKGFSA